MLSQNEKKLLTTKASPPPTDAKPDLCGRMALINIDGVTPKNKTQFEEEIQNLRQRGLGVAFFSRKTPPPASSQEIKIEENTEATALVPATPQMQLTPQGSAVMARSPLLGVQYFVIPEESYFDNREEYISVAKGPSRIIRYLLNTSSLDITYNLAVIFVDTLPNSKSLTTFFNVSKSQFTTLGSTFMCDNKSCGDSSGFRYAKFSMLKDQQMYTIEAAYLPFFHPSIVTTLSCIDQDASKTTERLTQEASIVEKRTGSKLSDYSAFSSQLQELINTSARLPQKPRYCPRFSPSFVMFITTTPPLVILFGVSPWLIHALPLWAFGLTEIGSGLLILLIGYLAASCVLRHPLNTPPQSSSVKIEEVDDDKIHPQQSTPTYEPRLSIKEEEEEEEQQQLPDSSVTIEDVTEEDYLRSLPHPS